MLSGQPLAPDTHHLIGEPMQAPTIPANAKVSEVAPQHRGQAAMLVAERPMAVFPAPGSNCSHRAAPCCMDRRYGRTEPDPCSGSCDADVLRASQLQHSV